MVVDVVLFLWSKVKFMFQKYQFGLFENFKYFQKMENLNKVNFFFIL